MTSDHVRGGSKVVRFRSSPELSPILRDNTDNTFNYSSGGLPKTAAESDEEARRIAFNPTGASKAGSAILCSLPVCPFFPVSGTSAIALPAVYAHEVEVGGMEAWSFDAD
jgi:hypothetical protein